MFAAPQAAAPLPFDRVIVHEGASNRALTTDEFFSLPLPQRIQFVVERRVSFFAGEVPVDPKEALARIRQSRARLH